MAKPVRPTVDRNPSKKYNIEQQLDLLSRAISIEVVVEHLKKFGVSRDDFYRDRRIPYGSAKSISADRLQIYAQVFDCTIEDLQNQPVKAKSIRALIDAPVHRKVSSKSKLR